MSVDAFPKLRRKQNLAFGIETTTGTPLTIGSLSGVTNIFNPNMEYTTETVERQAQGNLSPIPQGLGARAAKVTFEIEVKGSGTSGVTPVWLNLLLACGCVNTAGVLTPQTSNITTLTLALYIDGRLRVVSGCQGNVVMKLKRGQQVRLAFTFSGVQQPTDDTAIITPTYVTSPIAPRAGSTFTFATVALRLADIEFDLGNEVIMREDIGAVDTNSDPTGYRSALIVNRKPTFKFAPEAPAISVLDLATIYNTTALSALSLVIGTASHNMFTLAAPALQITSYPGIGDRSGLYTEDLTCLATRASSLGDDEWSLTLG